ncbi:MAG: hypothetical protein RR639_01780 [Hydrogenoanaerobacterium sp.]
MNELVTIAEPVAEATAEQNSDTLLQMIAENSEKQVRYAKTQLMLTKLCTAFLAVLLAVSVVLSAFFVPRINKVLTQADAVLTNAKTVSDELSGIDYPALAKRIDELIVTGDIGIAKALDDVERALKVIEQFDIKTLNSAISDLNRVVAPIAKLFGGMK